METTGGWLRKRPLNQSNESLHILQHSSSFHRSTEEEQYSPTTPSKSSDREYSSKPMQTPIHTLLPTLCTGYDGRNGGLTLPANILNSDQSKGQTMVDSPRRAHPINRFCSMPLPNNVFSQERMQSFPLYRRLRRLITKIRLWHKNAMQNSSRYECIFNKTKSYLCKLFKLLRAMFLELMSIKCTFKQKILFLSMICLSISSYVYFVKMPIWIYEEEWTQWEEGMQR